MLRNGMFEINREHFVPEEGKRSPYKQALDFIEALLNRATDLPRDRQMDIKVRPCIDFEGDVDVEWSVRDHDGSWGERLEWLDADEVKARWLPYPDGSEELRTSDVDQDEEVNLWLGGHKGWRKNRYGLWFNLKDSIESFLDSHGDEVVGRAVKDCEHKQPLEYGHDSYGFLKAILVTADGVRDYADGASAIVVGSNIAEALGMHEAKGYAWMQTWIPKALDGELLVVERMALDPNMVIYLSDENEYLGAMRFMPIDLNVGQSAAWR